MSAPRELKNLPKGDIIDHGAKAAREDGTSPSALRPHTTPKGDLVGNDMGAKVSGSDTKPH